MRPKIIFFDIDGTLLPIGESRVHPAVVEALTEAHDRGILLFVATGRAPYAIPDLGGIPFDGMMCFNGSYCFNAEGTIYADPMDPEDVKTVIKNAKRLGYPVTIATASRMGNNFYQKNLADYISISHLDYDIPADYERMTEEPVFQLMAGTTEDKDHLLIKDAPGVKTARWWDRATDIIPRACGKAKGAQMILDHYGIGVSDSMAFGDGGNDADLLEFAGCGVAMGNAAEETKKIADYVTDTCEKDGVATAFRHFNII